MKIKIISLIIAIILIIAMYVPVYAETAIPDPPYGAYDYWVVTDSDGEISLYTSPNPICVDYDNKGSIRLEIRSYKRYNLSGGYWSYLGETINTINASFNTIYASSHDIAYKDGSGFFFYATQSVGILPGSPPGEEQGNFWDDIEDYFSWFDPGAWLSDIGNLISEGLGVLAGPIETLGEGFNNFIDGVGDFFENLIDSLGTWFDNLGQWFDNLVNDLEQWFENIGQGLSRIIDALNPTSENFFLKEALVPSEGFYEAYVTDIEEMFDGRFTFISDLREFLGNLFGAVINPDPDPPEFEINLPGGKWGQGSVKIIDFSLFAPYRAFILNFIRVLLWIPFLLKLYRRLPQLVYQ